jgi:hypothetical protein
MLGSARHRGGELTLRPVKLRNALVALALGAGLASCGGSSAAHSPTLAQLPILPGASVAVRAQQCDKGNSPYCAIQLVVVDHAFTDNYAFLYAQRAWLHAHGWTGANGDDAVQEAADSPGHKLHLIYATAPDELQGWAFNWIKRRAAVIYGLSNTVFDGIPALSMMLEVGSGST